MIKINWQKFKNTNTVAFSLIEVLVSVSLFIVIIMSSTEIFRLVIEGQRDAIASQNVQSSLKYFFEVTSKEIRMAIRSEGACGVPSGDIFYLDTTSNGQRLRFNNYYKECVSYELDEDENEVKRFKITRGDYSGFISPNRIFINDLRFSLDTTNQPAVTINMQAWAVGRDKFKSEMDVQTTITSRYYRP